MPQVKPITKIHTAAAYFAFVSRDINKIAAQFQVKTRTVYRWAEEPEWQDALNACLYTGDRTFETQPFRDTERDAGNTFEIARQAYIEARDRGEPKHKLATRVEAQTGIPRRRIRTWARKFQW